MVRSLMALVLRRVLAWLVWHPPGWADVWGALSRANGVPPPSQRRSAGR